MAKVKTARKSSGGTAKKSSASRTVKSLGKQGDFRVMEIRAAVKKVAGKR